MKKLSSTATMPPTPWRRISVPCADFSLLPICPATPSFWDSFATLSGSESGEALIRKHAGKDRLFTPEGYREYALDLLERMTNPYLQDSVERVGRDPQRKLGWDDRLVGTLRLALQQNVVPPPLCAGDGSRACHA